MKKEDLLYVLNRIEIDNTKKMLNSDTIRSCEVNGSNVSIIIAVSNPSLQFKNKLQQKIQKHILAKFPNAEILIKFIILNDEDTFSKPVIKNTIAIASGKGGVGKSTISSNLAIALQKKGYQVGLIDADIYGPSIPLMFEAEYERPKSIKRGSKSYMSPVISYGVKIMSIGFFSKPSDAIIWRGPMATKALNEIINQTDWGSLDYLLIDLPPGTGDIHLSIVQTLSLTGSIIVTTPQSVALIDAKKAVSMFKKKEINVPVLGLVENMSWLQIDNTRHYIFGKDGGVALSDTESIPLLVQLPLDQSIREAGDVGRPAALQHSILGDIFLELVEKLDISIQNRKNQLPPTKKVEITHNKGCS